MGNPDPLPTLLKIRILSNLYNNLNFCPDGRKLVFPTMLKGLALDYYFYNKEKQRDLTLNQICNNFKVTFEGVEHKRIILF